MNQSKIGCCADGILSHERKKVLVERKRNHQIHNFWVRKKVVFPKELFSGKSGYYNRGASHEFISFQETFP